MRGVVQYLVTCKQCKQSTKLGLINEQNIIWDKVSGNIISGRKRLDGEWGFQCAMCGNNDIMTDQEKSGIKNLEDPDIQDIRNIVDNLQRQEPRFVMQQA